MIRIRVRLLWAVLFGLAVSFLCKGSHDTFHSFIHTTWNLENPWLCTTRRPPNTDGDKSLGTELISSRLKKGLPRWLSGKESACNAGSRRRHRFNPCVYKEKCSKFIVSGAGLFEDETD